MANRFWVNISGGTWDNSATSNWSTTSAGASGASVPGSADTAIFDGNSGSATITTNYNVSIIAVQQTAAFSGNLTLGGSLTQALSSSGVLSLLGGTFNAGNQNLSVWSVTSNGTVSRTVTMGSGTWTLTGNNITIWNISNTGLTLNANTSTIAVTDTGSNPKSFALAGLTLYNISIAAGGSGAINITSNATPSAINGVLTINGPKTVTFQNNRQFNLANAPALNSSSGNVITITSNQVGTQAKLDYTGSGILTYDYLSFQDINVLVPGVWYVGSNSTNTSNNSYLIFLSGPPAGTGQGILTLI